MGQRLYGAAPSPCSQRMHKRQWSRFEIRSCKEGNDSVSVVCLGGGNSTKATLKVTRGNQLEETQNKNQMKEDQVIFKANQEDRLRVSKARKELFKYASDRKHKALLRQVESPPPPPIAVIVEVSKPSGRNRKVEVCSTPSL